MVCGAIGWFAMSAEDQATGSSMTEDGSSMAEDVTVGYLMPDLSQATPVAFVLNVRQAYVDGKGKAGQKFQALREQVTTSLPTAPPPGPGTFVVQCIHVLLSMDPPYNEGLSHLLTSAYRHLSAEQKPEADTVVARRLAAGLFINAVITEAKVESRVLVRIIVVFQIQLVDIGQILVREDCSDEQKIKEARATVEPFILNLVKEKFYTSAVTLLKQFDLQDCTPQEFLLTMVNAGQAELAGQWAAHLGKDMSCLLVRQCTDLGYYKVAYKLVERYQLGKDFPDAYQHYRRSTIRKLVEKGLWDVAEAIATEAHLQEYLVNFATEEGYTSKVAGLCQRFRLEHAACEAALKEDDGCKPLYLQLSSVVHLENVFFVDSAEGLASAAEHLLSVTVVGIDCEWKANREKGREENKVSILQLATPEKVFVFDLIGLAETESVALDHCIKQVFHSANILKLGYAVSNDLKRLLQSYQNLSCFVRCESVLDLQTFAGAKTGGLSGLTKLALGNPLDKRSRMTNWEQRPLTTEQLHYAALDAAVLLSIFGYLSAAPPGTSSGLDEVKDWQSMLISFRSTWKKSSNVDHCAGKSLQNLDTDVGRSQDEPHCSQEDVEADDILNRLVYGEGSSGFAEPGGSQAVQEDYVRTVVGGASSWTLAEQRNEGTPHLDHGNLSGDQGGTSCTPRTLFADRGAEEETCTERSHIVTNFSPDENSVDNFGPSAKESLPLPIVDNTESWTAEMTALVHGQQESILTSVEDVHTPGLLKNEFEELALALGLPSPLYQTICWGQRRVYGNTDKQTFMPLALSEILSLKISGGLGIASTQLSLGEVARSLIYSPQLQIVRPQLSIFSAFDQACLHQHIWLRDVRSKQERTFHQKPIGSATVGCCPSVKMSMRRDFQPDAFSLRWLQQWGQGLVLSIRAAEAGQQSWLRSGKSFDRRQIVSGSHLGLKKQTSAATFRKAGLCANVTPFA